VSENGVGHAHTQEPPEREVSHRKRVSSLICDMAVIRAVVVVVVGGVPSTVAVTMYARTAAFVL
jgi:hypothetical protein